MERSVIRDWPTVEVAPDFAALHPGYDSRSIRPWQSEHVLCEIRQKHVRRDRRYLVEPCLAELALDIELLREAEAAVRLHAHLGRRPRGVRCQELRHVGLGAAVALRLVEGGS